MTMPDDPFTPAELEAGCIAVHELEDDSVDRYLSVQNKVGAAFRAAVPLIAARVRAEERESIIETFLETPLPGVPWDVRETVIAIARAHRTTTGEGSSDAC